MIGRVGAAVLADDHNGLAPPASAVSAMFIQGAAIVLAATADVIIAG